MGHSHKYTAGPNVAAKDAAIDAARLKLNKQERQELTRLARRWANVIGSRRGGRGFGQAAARELFWKLRVWMILKGLDDGNA